MTSEFFCPGCPYSGYCDELCGFCGEYGSLLRDCHGVEAPSVFIGDGFCDNGTYLYDGKTVDFDCPAFGCDGGDCPSASECGTDAPTPSGPRERDVYAATIEEIQRRATLDFEDDDGDDASIVFDCSRSVLSHRVVRVSGVVSAVAGTGFYFQDGVGPWSASSHAGSTAPSCPRCASATSWTSSATSTSTWARRRSRSRATTPSAWRSSGGGALRGRRRRDGDAGAYRRRERDDVDGARCPDAGEPYEGVLVRVSDVALSGSADAFGRVAADDGSGGTLLDSSSAFDTAAYLAALVRPHDGCRSGAIWEPPRQDWDDYGLTSGTPLCDYGGVVLASVTGVARYAWKCATPQDHLACLAGGARMDFTFAVAPRHPRDLRLAPESFDAAATPSRRRRPGPPTASSPRVRRSGAARRRLRGPARAGRPRRGDGVRRAARVGSGARRRRRRVGLVVESMGSTVLEAVDVVVTGSGTLEALAIRSGDLGGGFRDVEASGCFSAGEGLESLLVAVDDVDVAVYDGADYCPTCLGRLPFDDGSGAALLDDALYAGGVLERDVTERTVFGDGVSTAPLAALTGVVRYAYACENREDPVYCLSRGAGLGFAYVVAPRTAADLRYEVEAPDDRPSLLDKQRRRGRRVDVATVVAVGVLAPVGARVDPGMALPQHQIEIPVAQARVVPDAAEAPDDGVPLADARPRRRDPSQMTFRIRLRDGPRPPAPAPRAVSEGAAPPPPDRSAPPEATAVFDDPATVAEPVPVDGFAYVPAPRPRRDSDDSRSSDEPYAEDRLPRPHPRGRQTYIIRGLRRPPRSPRPDEAPAPESSEAARHAPPPALAGPPPRAPEPEEPAEEAKDESGGPRPRAPAFASADEEKADEEVVFKSGATRLARAPDAEEAGSRARPD
ncbi:sulfuric ester hydrolase [Aureococcus anophagefferens]|nr:sulfuric ester hydrolase [Aureococcus anophagefferens]